MEPLKRKAIETIESLPDSADIDEIMYRLYVLDKVERARDAVSQGDVVSSKELKKDLDTW